MNTFIFHDNSPRETHGVYINKKGAVKLYINWNGLLRIPPLPSISFPPPSQCVQHAHLRPICAYFCLLTPFFSKLRLLLPSYVYLRLQVLIGGSSAGGLALLTHCDYLRSKLPLSTSVKCLSEAGVFVSMEGCHSKPLGLNHAHMSLYETYTTILSAYSDLRYGYTRRCVWFGVIIRIRNRVYLIWYVSKVLARVSLTSPYSLTLTTTRVRIGVIY